MDYFFNHCYNYKTHSNCPLSIHLFFLSVITPSSQHLVSLTSSFIFYFFVYLILNWIWRVALLSLFLWGNLAVMTAQHCCTVCKQSSYLMQVLTFRRSRKQVCKSNQNNFVNQGRSFRYVIIHALLATEISPFLWPLNPGCLGLEPRRRYETSDISQVLFAI